MRVVPLLLLLAVPLLGGCTAQVDGPVLVLRYTLWRDGDLEAASPGPHCGTADVAGGHVEVERDAWRQAGAGRHGLLVVLPRLGPGWATTGEEGYPLGLPATVDPGVEGSDDLLARIAFEDGEATVDGAAVTLPHRWEARGHGWNATAELSEGPARVQTYRGGPCA